MADIVIQPVWQVLDGNGEPVSGARVSFFDSGTTTPLTVYTDTGLSVPHASPVVADANGVMPPVYTGGAVSKAVIKTSADVTIKTVDPVPRSPSGSTGASQISFSPTVEIPSLNVQAAIEAVQANLTASSTAFAKTLLDDVTASDMLTTLGVSAFVQTLVDDASAAAFLTTLGVSAFIQTLLNDADASAARLTLGAPPRPINGTGEGDWRVIAATVGNALALPAGGTWAWFMILVNAGSIAGFNAAINAGGATIYAGAPGIIPTALAWRVA